MTVYTGFGIIVGQTKIVRCHGFFYFSVQNFRLYNSQLLKSIMHLLGMYFWSMIVCLVMECVAIATLEK